MFIKWFLVLVFALLFAGCRTNSLSPHPLGLADSSNETRVSAQEDSSPSTINDVDIPGWRIDGFGRIVLFPSQQDFVFHSKVAQGDLVSYAWIGPKLGPFVPQDQFSAGLVRLTPSVPADGLAKIIDYAADKEARRCEGKYHRVDLVKPTSERRAEVTACRLRHVAFAREYVVHLYVREHGVLFMTHWVETQPSIGEPDLNNPRWRQRLDSMSPVVICLQSLDKELIPKACLKKLPRKAVAAPQTQGN